MPHIVPQTATLLSATPEAEALIELAGRTCYKSEDKITADSAKAFVKMLRTRKHVSVIEHAVATLRFTTDRGISHELVRHRLASYSQESTRFVNYYKKGEIRVVRPLSFKNAATEASWYRAMASAEAEYNFMISEGEPPEVARDVLPTCTATDIVMTANFREWKHVLDMRHKGVAGKPHPKMVALMTLALPLFLGFAQTVFGDDA